MFELSNAYSGAMVRVENGEGGPITADNPEHSYHQNPEQIIAQAREQADAILEQAKSQASALKEEIFQDAKLEVERKIADFVNNTCADLGVELWSARNAISDIVEQSLHAMVGEVGKHEAIFRAVEKAAKDHADAYELKIFAETETANRLRLIELGRKKTPCSAKFTIMDDHTIQPDRCVLDIWQKRFEVSLDAQIDALKRAAQHAVQNLESPNASHKVGV